MKKTGIDEILSDQCPVISEKLHHHYFEDSATNAVDPSRPGNGSMLAYYFIFGDIRSDGWPKPDAFIAVMAAE